MSKDSLYLTKEELTSITVVGQFPYKESKMRRQVMIERRLPGHSCRGMRKARDKGRNGRNYGLSGGFISA